LKDWKIFINLYWCASERLHFSVQILCA